MNVIKIKRPLILTIVIPIFLILSSCTKKENLDDELFEESYEINEVVEEDEIHESYGDYGVGVESDSNKKDIVINHPQLDMEDFESLENVEPVNSSANAIIRIFKGVVVNPKSKVDAEIIIDFLFDPVDPASSAYNKMLQNELKKEIDNGTVEMRYRVVPYLNDKSMGDYSNRASSYILAVAEYAPNYSQSFINTILSSEFQPSSPASEYTSDDLFTEAMRKVGISNDNISKVENNKDSFVSVSIASAKDFTDENSKLLSLSRWKDESGKLITYTPFITINKAGSSGSMALKVHSVNPRSELRKEVESKSK